MTSASGPIRISDRADPRITPYTRLRDRDLRADGLGHADRFVAEGEVVLRILLAQHRYPIDSLFLLDTRLPRLAPLLEALPSDVPVYVADRSVMDGVVGFPLHRGILAMGRRGVPEAPETLLQCASSRALVLGLVGLANHDNVGGVFRNAAAFGADAILLDRETCDPLYRKAIRVSVGASLTVPFGRLDSASDMLGCLQEAGFGLLAMSPGGAVTLDRAPWSARTAILLGTEGPGLPSNILARCTSVAVPMAKGFDSLNVATTAGIALYAARTAGQDAA